MVALREPLIVASVLVAAEAVLVRNRRLCDDIKTLQREFQTELAGDEKRRQINFKTDPARRAWQLLQVSLSSLQLRHSVLPQPEQFAVSECPSCGKADWAIRFEGSDESSDLSQAASPAHLQFRAAAMEYERSGADFYNIGMLYLHAAWCADDMRADAQAREYRKLAADAFRKSLVDVSCPVERRPEIEYLVGELLRRAGEFEAARAHFNAVVPRLPSRFALMARKLMRLSDSRSTEAIDFDMNGG